jgi:L-lactate dehydrogenase complex protein LldE
VQLLVTCLVDQFFPDTGMAVVTLLERLGLTVDVPANQTCCGQPAFNAGFTDEARAMARHTIDVLSASDAPVVIPSGSCGDMVIHQYAALLKDDPVYGPKAEALDARTYELTQFLVDVLGVTDVGAVAGGRVAYHACCHGLRGLGVKNQPLELLEAVRGVERCPLEESEVCCGFGGLFAVKMADISSAMLGRKLDRIDATGADTIIVTDVSCAMHMNGGLHRRGSRTVVKHLAELLASTK